MNMARQLSDFARKCADLTPRDQRNVRRYQLWMLGWALVYVGATFLVASERIAEGPAAWLVALFPSVLAVFTARAYWRFLREGDELMRAIELQALGLAVGLGFVLWPALRLGGLLGLDLEAWSDLPILAMIFAYALGVILGRRHYA